MPIFEEGSNFPTILGRKNVPPVIIRAQKLLQSRASIPIGQQAMALITGETPIHLAQRFSQTPGGGSQLPPFNAPGIFSVVPQVFKQRTIIQTVKTRFPILKKLAPQVEKNVPRPYGPGSWPPGKAIAGIPSAMGIVGGPSRTVLPQISVIT